jgi:hypothetical protein
MVDRARFELATSSTLVDTQRRRHCQGGDLVPHDLTIEVMTGLIYRPMVAQVVRLAKRVGTVKRIVE